MEAVMAAALVMLSVMPELEWALGQRAPCYECEVYKDLHPQSNPYEEIRSHCSYPCECVREEIRCLQEVSVVRDGCGCCTMCARQRGESCDGTALCDERRGLVCQYPSRGASTGVCQVIKGLPCTVYNRTYDNGETFLLDCRTQCACQNGTYACSSLCPLEYISPQGSCNHPRLVEVPGQCCREWMCDSASAQHPPDCQQQFSPWSPCSSRCGLGLSHRMSNINPQCLPTNESRLCQVRPCEGSGLVSLQRVRHHHVRKGHECKATQRVSSAVHLQFGPCRSRRRYHPKMCGGCQCCRPQLSTTIRVEFYCRVGDTSRDTILDLAEPGSDLWDDSDDFSKDQSLLHSPPWRLRENRRRLFSGSVSGEEHSVSFDVEWILKCRCSESCDEDTTGGTTPRNLEGEVILHRVHRTAAP